MIKKLLFVLLALSFTQNVWAKIQQSCPNDTIPPQVVYCPSDTTIYTESLTAYLDLQEPVFTDNCGIKSITNMRQTIQPFEVGTNYIYINAIDSSSNESVCAYSIKVTKIPLNTQNAGLGNILKNANFDQNTQHWLGNGISYSSAYVQNSISIALNGYVKQRVEAKRGYDYFLRSNSSGEIETEISFLDANEDIISPPKSTLSNQLTYTAPSNAVWIEVKFTNIDTVTVVLKDVSLLSSIGDELYAMAGCPKTIIDGNYEPAGYDSLGRLNFNRTIGQDLYEVCTFSGKELINCRLLEEKKKFAAKLIGNDEIVLLEDSLVVKQQQISATIKSKFSEIKSVYFAEGNYFLIGYSDQIARTALVVKLDSSLNFLSDLNLNSSIGYPEFGMQSELLNNDVIILHGKFAAGSNLYYNVVIISTNTMREFWNFSSNIGTYKYLGDGLLMLFLVDLNSYSYQGSHYRNLYDYKIKITSDESKIVSKKLSYHQFGSAGSSEKESLIIHNPSFTGVKMDYSENTQSSGPFPIYWKTTWENYFSLDSNGLRYYKPLALFSNSKTNVPLTTIHGFFESNGNKYRILEYADTTTEIQCIDCDLNPQTTSCPANLLKNPTLQNNQQHWQSQGAKPQNGTIQLCEKGDFIQQTLSAEAGKTYKLELKAQSQTTNHLLQFGLKFMDANWQTIENYATDFELQTAFSSDFIEKTAPNGSVWMEITAINENGACLQIKEICLTNPNGNSSPTPDLELSIKSDVVNPPLWTAVPFSLHLENKGTETMYDIQVQLPAQMDADFSDKMAYVSHSADAGSSFNYWSGVWEIPKIELGESVDLNYTVFRKTTEPISIFAQIIEQRPLDLDSKPANNVTQLPSEDDEVLLVFDALNFVVQRAISAENEEFLRIFPNPTSAILHIDLADYLGSDVSLILVDAFGREVQSQKVAESHHLARAEMDVRGLENGLYFLRVESADKRPLVQRVVVEHGQ